MMESVIKGVICEIYFEREDTGFKIIGLDCDGKLVTVKGVLPYSCVGETIEATGRWQENSDYGPQFIVDSYETFVPKNLEDIVLFLQSDTFEGIGEVTAMAIAEKFGDRTLDVLENHPEELSKVRGINEKKAAKICETYNSYLSVYELFSFLRKYDIKMSVATALYKKIGEDVLKNISENPYGMIDKVPQYHFKDADKIAMSLGIPYNSSIRISAGIECILKDKVFEEGHVFYPREELIPEITRLLEINEEDAEEGVEALKNENRIVAETVEPYGCCLYLSRLYGYEHFIKTKFENLSGETFEFDEKNFENVIETFEKDEGLIMGDMQKEAVRTAGEKGFLVVTGGPGTGKTTIIKAITRYFDMRGFKTVLCAPTGRAAKRITESCGKEAKTIHRLLEVKYNYEEEETRELKFKKNENDPLDADVIIVDESSMIDVILMYHLLKAMKSGARLILVGDKDQLPSVGPGKILADIISDSRYPRVILDEIYRQAKESLIAINAHKINCGEMPVLNDREKDFFFIRCRDQEECAKAVTKLCSERLPNAYNFDPMKDIQVVSPTKQGKCGTVNLNKMLQEILNEKRSYKKEKEYAGKVFREGDRVMHIRNNYEMEWEKVDDPLTVGVGVFNGEMGTVSHVNPKSNSITVVFDDDRFAVYEKDNINDLEHSYAITAHKSQGSEFDCCVIPLMGIPYMLMSRNILYTAITRAKKFVVLLGDVETMKKMIENNRVQFRYTGLGVKENDKGAADFEMGADEEFMTEERYVTFED